jgi:hypothetical protein
VGLLGIEPHLCLILVLPFIITIGGNIKKSSSKSKKKREKKKLGPSVQIQTALCNATHLLSATLSFSAKTL